MSSLFRHASAYAVGTALVTLASLVSFPILTRLLSVADYGLMNTVTLALALLVAVGKLGMQRATVRFYHEGGETSARLPSTQILGMAAVGALATLTWMCVVALLPEHALGTPGLRYLLLLTACLVLVRVLDSAFSNLLYAEGRSAFISTYGVVKRYLALVLVIGVLLASARNAEGFFLATIVAEVVALVWIGWVVAEDNPVRPTRFSRELFIRMIAYGVPMVGVEVAGSILALGDRYVIQQLLGAEAVGVYSASYNLCEYIRGSTMAALSTAVAPMYMRVWEQEGRVATEQFLGRFARSYLAVSFLVAALVTTNAADLVTILASERYVEGTTIVPWVIGGMALDSYVAVAAAGLFLKKRTGAIFTYVAIAAAVNIALNYLLVPHFGIAGSAIATLLSYAVLLATAMVIGRSELTVPFPARSLVVSAFAFGASCMLAARMTSGSPWFDLVLRTAIVIAIYGGITLTLDAGVRDSVRELARMVRNRLWPDAV